MKKLRIGVYACELQHDKPRGIERVSRAIAERLAVREDISTVCLIERIPLEPFLTYEIQDLAQWLSENQIVKPVRYEAVTPYAGFKSRISRVLPSFIRKPLRAMYRATNALRRPLAPLVLPIYRSMKRSRIHAVEIAQDNRRTCTLNDLDIVLKFWPWTDVPRGIENHRAKLISWCHDIFTIALPHLSVDHSEEFASRIADMVMFSDRIVCVSKHTEKELQDYFPYARGKTSIVYNGHDSDRFRSAARRTEVEQALADKGFRAGVPYFLFVGGLEPRKNFVGILKASRALARSLKDVPFQLLIIGNQALHKGYDELLAIVQKDVNIVMPGYLPDGAVESLMAGAHAFMLPSFTEGFGIPILEAMSAGTIVIVGDTGAMPEVAQTSGLYCDPYDHFNIADVMRRSLEMSAEERARRIQMGRAHAACFTWENSLQELLGLLREEAALHKPGWTAQMYVNAVPSEE